MTTSPHTPYILEEEEETDVEENMEETVENQVPSPSSPHTPIESIREHKQERDIEEKGTSAPFRWKTLGTTVLEAWRERGRSTL